MDATVAEIFKFLLAPGFVAALVTFALNTRDERHRTAREYQTKFIEETRKDVRDAVSAGVAYFSNTDDAKLPALHATVLLYEHEVRSSLAAIKANCGDDDKKVVTRIEALERDFLDYLTGGEFGSASSTTDAPRVRMIVGQGALLRGALSSLRRQQLDAARIGFGRPALFLTLLLALMGLCVLYGFSLAL
jgi:hypothetical protein